jgi:hypothetical protein
MTMATWWARLTLNNLSKVDPKVLAKLKAKLNDFDARSRVWRGSKEWNDRVARDPRTLLTFPIRLEEPNHE